VNERSEQILLHQVFQKSWWHRPPRFFWVWVIIKTERAKDEPVLQVKWYNYSKWVLDRVGGFSFAQNHSGSL
jgi:hypothetical protein